MRTLEQGSMQRRGLARLWGRFYDARKPGAKNSSGSLLFLSLVPFALTAVARRRADQLCGRDRSVLPNNGQPVFRRLCQSALLLGRILPPSYSRSSWTTPDDSRRTPSIEGDRWLVFASVSVSRPSRYSCVRTSSYPRSLSMKILTIFLCIVRNRIFGISVPFNRLFPPVEIEILGWRELSIDRTLGTRNSAGRSRPHENEASMRTRVWARRVITRRAL